MKNNKIINLPNPNRNNDASNKFYVDDSIIKATKNYGVLITELDKLQKENSKLQSNLERLSSATNQLGLDIAAGVAKEIKTHDEHFTKVETAINKNKGEFDAITLRINSLKTNKQQEAFVNEVKTLLFKEIELLRNKVDRHTNYKLYSAILDIGTNPNNDTEKNTYYNFTFPYKILLERIHLQLSMNEQTIYITQHINCIIRRVDQINDNTIRVYVMTYRTNPYHINWGIHVQAYLTIMVYDTVPKTTLTLDYPVITSSTSTTTFIS